MVDSGMFLVYDEDLPQPPHPSSPGTGGEAPTPSETGPSETEDGLWASLPDDILFVIFSRLRYAEWVAACAGVCRSWRAVATKCNSLPLEWCSPWYRWPRSPAERNTEDAVRTPLRQIITTELNLSPSDLNTPSTSNPPQTPRDDVICGTEYIKKSECLSRYSSALNIRVGMGSNVTLEVVTNVAKALGENIRAVTIRNVCDSIDSAGSGYTHSRCECSKVSAQWLVAILEFCPRISSVDLELHHLLFRSDIASWLTPIRAIPQLKQFRMWMVQPTWTRASAKHCLRWNLAARIGPNQIMGSLCNLHTDYDHVSDDDGDVSGDESHRTESPESSQESTETENSPRPTPSMGAEDDEADPDPVLLSNMMALTLNKTDLTARSLACLGQACPDLQELCIDSEILACGTMDGCVGGLDDNVVSGIPIVFPKLRKLSLFGMDNVTDDGVVGWTMPALETLQLGGHINLTAQGVHDLAQGCPRLKHFVIDGCPANILLNRGSKLPLTSDEMDALCDRFSDVTASMIENYRIIRSPSPTSS